MGVANCKRKGLLVSGHAGPCISTDTACSSSLVATHLAHSGVLNNESFAAIAGGVNIMLAPLTTVAICQLQVKRPALKRFESQFHALHQQAQRGGLLPQALSPAGRCKSFDASGDGYGRGEGFVSALLTQHQSGPAAIAVVRGSAVNQDGRSSGLTAPNGPSQTRLVLGALQQGGTEPGLLRLVAVHGTGTPLGDPIEVGALGQAVGSSPGSTAAPVVLSSIKACYGHTEGAAGLTGLLLAAHCSVQVCSPPVMHLRNNNTYVEAALRDWTRNSRLCAAIPRQQQTALFAAQLAGTSSFGMSGVNAHVIMCAPQCLVADLAGPASVAKHLLRGQSLWPMAPMHHLIHSCMPASQHAVFSCSLSQSTLAYIWQQQTMGSSTLPATAAWALLGAAAHCQSNTAAALCVCQATMAWPVHCRASMVISCTVQHDSGVLHLLTHDEGVASMPCITASVATVASVLRNPYHVKMVPHTHRLLNSPPSPVPGSPCNSISIVPVPQARPGHGCCCHPTVIQAAATLSGNADSVVGCGLYLPACTGQSSHVTVEAGNAAATLRSAEGTAATHVHEIVTRPTRALQTTRANAALTAPCWRLAWHPAAISKPSIEANDIKALLVSSAVWPLSALCSGQPAQELPLLAMNAVWGSGIPSCGCKLQCPEISLGSDVHLHTLTQFMEPQLCVYVQPPGSSVNVHAALASYRLVARSANNVCMTLVTYDQSLIGSSATCPDASVAVLQGEVAGSGLGYRRCTIMVAKMQIQP